MYSHFDIDILFMVITSGRPHVEELFKRLPQNTSTMALVCAQEGLANVASDAAQECGFSFSIEEFAF